jgi:Fanconi anemia group M protein
MILVDDRELKSGICVELEKLNIKFKVLRLSIGDYIINDNIFIERKTVADFLESLSDQRLSSQVANLRKDNKRAIIIIEGNRLPGSPRIRGALCSLASRWYIPVLRSANLKGTAWILSTLLKYENYECKPYCAYDFRSKRSVSSMEEKMLMQMRGVGPDMAKKLLKKFGSINNIINAQDDDLMEIAQVGKVVIAQINILRGLKR